MENSAMNFENLIKKYFGTPPNSFYYADYFDDNNQTKALLFGVCHLIINKSSNNFDEQILFQIEKFKKDFIANTISYDSCVKLVNALST